MPASALPLPRPKKSMLLPGRDVEGSHSRPDSSGNNVLVSRRPSHRRPLHPPPPLPFNVDDIVEGQIFFWLKRRA